MKNNNVDILHFDVEVFSPNRRRFDIQYFKNYVTPAHEMSFNSSFSIISEVYTLDQKYRWTIWQNVYRSKILKIAYSHIRDFPITMAEDCYQYFIISYFSSNFLYLKTPPLYFYRIGSGVSTGKSLSYSEFCQTIFSQYQVYILIKEFLHRQGALQLYKKQITFLHDLFVPTDNSCNLTQMKKNSNISKFE